VANKVVATPVAPPTRPVIVTQQPVAPLYTANPNFPLVSRNYAQGAGAVYSPYIPTGYHTGSHRNHQHTPAAYYAPVTHRNFASAAAAAGYGYIPGNGPVTSNVYARPPLGLELRRRLAFGSAGYSAYPTTVLGPSGDVINTLY